MVGCMLNRKLRFHKRGARNAVSKEQSDCKALHGADRDPPTPVGSTGCS